VCECRSGFTGNPFVGCQDINDRCNARTASVCLLATPTRTVPSMSAVCRDSAC
jgi:hypothetical protein